MFQRARTQGSRGLPLVLIVVLGATLPVLPVQAQPVPIELDILCVYRDDKVFQASHPSDCTKREVAIDVPATRPVHLCARDDFGLVRYAKNRSSCKPGYEFPLTIPDDGPHILCSENLKKGQVQPRGGLRYADNVARCDAKYYTPFITPAAPEAVADRYTVDEDSRLSVPARGVLGNDADASGGPLTARLITGPAVGAVALSADGSFTYDARGLFDDLDVGQSRDVGFTYATSDGELESPPAGVTITVTGRNDRPVALADAYSTDEDTPKVVFEPGVLGNDSDAESKPLTAHLVQAPTAGAVLLAEDGSLRFDPANSFQHLGDGDLGEARFTYVARDGSDDSDAVPVTITVRGVNDAPVAAADHYTTDENTPLTITAAQLLANDVDAEGSPLTVADRSAGSPAGTFTFRPDGAVEFDPRTAFDGLGDGQTALATFTYAASDGGRTSAPVTVRIVVTGISAPVAVDDRASTDEDTPIEIDILDNDTAAGARVTIQRLPTSSGSATFADGVVTFDPRGHHDDLQAGDPPRIDRFGYVLTTADGESEQAIVTVEVSGVDDTPVAVADFFGGIALDRPLQVDAEHGLLSNDLDPDTARSALTALLVSPPAKGHLELRPDGGFWFDPAGEVAQGDTVTFRYRVTDRTGESTSALVTLSTTS